MASTTQESTISTTEQKVQVKIPDGRKDSTGEPLASPTETWRPTFERKQSWNPQDLKRQMLAGELKKEGHGGQGFTEVGEERKS